ncbi:hypothetical protein N183_22390 [Sinorhizobium sp. Sb3]|nr:hypothetical protein N183_22390 [Sinorhizobium sp. Sb3]
MSVAPLHTHAFFEEVLESGFVWTIRDETGFSDLDEPVE